MAPTIATPEEPCATEADIRWLARVLPVALAYEEMRRVDRIIFSVGYCQHAEGP